MFVQLTPASGNEPAMINLALARRVHPYLTGAKIVFDNDDFVQVRESYQFIADALAGAGLVSPRPDQTPSIPMIL